MDLSKISYFLTAAEMENFTRAAEACHIAQTTMSKYIASLEKEIGVPLFLRDHREAHLTPEGRTFYQGISAIANDYENLLHSLHPTQEIHLGMALQEYVEIPILKNFQKNFPTIPLYFSFKQEKELQDDLCHHVIDGLISPDAISPSVGMSNVELFPFSQSFVCSQSLWDTYGNIPAIIPHMPLITKTENPLYHDQCQHRFQQSFGKTFPQVLTCHTLAEQLLRISLSQGFAILPLSSENNYDDLSVHPLPAIFNESILLTYDPAHVSPAFAKLLQFIHEKKC